MSSTSEEPLATTTAEGPSVTRADGPQSSRNDGESRAVVEGTVVGRYVIVGRLGEGGMGEVLAAYDPKLDRRVALKLIRGSSRATETARARLEREAQALAKLNHPNVVAVYDVGTHEDSVFVAMEHIKGTTLKEWLEEPRSWSRAVEVMVEAGRGLAAAHTAGLIHRDFKPANVMLGDDERVRVLDFGIARMSDDASSSWGGGPPPEARASSAHLETSAVTHELTEVGTVVGTPAYMAPEQFLAGPVDPRTDQFAFCIVLYRALYGAPPFEAKTYKELAIAANKGGVVPPATKGVPRPIRQALARGLSPSPEARFPSMDALLAELERGLGQRRRRLVAGGVTVAMAAIVTALAWGRTSDDPPCEGVGDELAEIWNDDRRAAVEAAVLETRASYASDAAVRVREGLDAYAARWVEARVDACEATHVRAEQSEHLMDLRIACLRRDREQLRAAVELLAAADLQVVQHAVDLTQQLPGVAKCADVERLTAELPPPEDPDTAAEVEALRAELAHIDVQFVAGKYDDAGRRLEPVQTRADALGYAPLQTEVLARKGGLMVFEGHAEDGLKVLDEALWKAIEIGHTQMEAMVLIAEIHVLGNNRPADPLALRTIRNAEAVLVRLGNPVELTARAAMHSGSVFTRRRELDEAVARYRRAIELSADLPEAQPVRISALINLSMTLNIRGESDAALEVIEETIDEAIGRLGPKHPSIGLIYHNLGSILYTRGDYERALEQFERAYALNVESLGPKHPELGKNLLNMSLALRDLGRTDEAIDASRRGLELKRAILGPNDPSLGVAVNNHGDFLLQAKRNREALEHFEEAKRIFGKAPERIYPVVSIAEAWLALGEPERGVEPALEVLGMLDSGSYNPAELSLLWFAVARVLWAAGEDRARARSLAEQARAKLESVPGDQSKPIAEIDAWLGEHP